MNLEFFDNLLRIKEQGQAFVVVTLIDIKGSAPQNIGAKMIVGEKGVFYGTIGGGKIEAHCLKRARYLLLEKKGHSYEQINLQRDIGMSCGGEVQLLFEGHFPEKIWEIAVFGAGHISQKLCRQLLELDCHIFCIDSRQEWLEKLPEDKNLKKICLKSPADYISELKDEAFVCVMTQGHKSDLPILEKSLNQRNFPYLGVIGSQSKKNALELELLELGVTRDRLETMICPMGEKVGSHHPGEIGISIIFQILKKRDSLVRL